MCCRPQETRALCAVTPRAPRGRNRLCGVAREVGHRRFVVPPLPDDNRAAEAAMVALGTGRVTALRVAMWVTHGSQLMPALCAMPITAAMAARGKDIVRRHPQRGAALVPER